MKKKKLKNISVENDPLLKIEPKNPVVAHLLKARKAYLESKKPLLNSKQIRKYLRD